MFSYLSSVSKRLLQPRSLPAIVVPVKDICTSQALFKKDKNDYRKPIDCPAPRDKECKNQKGPPCSPTDPPVHSCNEQYCKKPRYPCCVNTRISKSPCEKSGHSKDFKPRPDPFVSMWESYKGAKDKRPEYLWHYPEHCCPKCEDVRFDVLYYKPSEKCRTYQRTWWECCPRMVPKRVCCWCDAVPPQVLRRNLPICPRSACTMGQEKSRMDCLNRKSQGCQRLQMPCCRAARIPPSCQITRVSSGCQKIKCPFPSFSECVQEDRAVIPERPPECRCRKMPLMCERFSHAAHMAKHGIALCPCPKCPQASQEFD